MVTSVETMRRTVFMSSLVVFLLWLCAPAFTASAATTTTSTSLPILCAPSADPTVSTVPVVGCINPVLTTSTSTTSTTTTTVPSAVTTVPEGCVLPPIAQAVFVGSVKQSDPVSAIFLVSQVRAGSLDGYISTANTVEVRYGGDVKYLDTGKSYIVGVAVNETTRKLASTVRDSAEIFGVPEAIGSNIQCPRFEDAARTINVDGTSIDSGLFVNFFDKPLLLLASFLFPPVLVFMGLVGLVWFRRGTRR